MRNTALVRAASAIGVATCLAGGFVHDALAQAAAPPPPAARSVDSNGVDILNGTISTADLPVLQTAGISLRPTGFPKQDSLTGVYNGGFSYGNTTIDFTTVGSVVVPKYGQQGSYSCTTIDWGVGTCTLILGDGTQVIYDKTKRSNVGIIANGGMVTQVIKPDGEILNYTYQPWGPYPLSGQTLYSQLLLSVTSSLGWMVQYNGVTVTVVSKASIINTSIDYCDPATTSDCTASGSVPWPYMTFGSYADSLGTIGSVGTYQSWTGPSNYFTAIAVMSTEKGVVRGALLDSNNGYKVKDFSMGAGSNPPYKWTYYFPNPQLGQTDDRTVVTDSYGKTRTYMRDPAWAAVRHLNSFTDELNRTTSYQYTDAAKGPARVITPEATFSGSTLTGGYTDYTYDDRNNLTSVTVVPKGGGTPLVTLVNYDSVCANPKTCNKPNWVRDPKGNQTDYTYDSTHGGILTETAPADANGIRPQKRYSYSLLYPKVKNSAGVLVNSTPVWRLTRVSVCQTAVAGNPGSCVGTAQELVTTYAYNNNNLLQTSVTVAAGDNSVSATTTYTYDAYGNRTSADGPLSGSDDMTYVTYDIRSRPVFEIGADPDAGGALKRSIVKHTYDAKNRETLTEYGTGNATNGSDFIVVSFKRYSYDAVSGLLIKAEVGQP